MNPETVVQSVAVVLQKQLLPPSSQTPNSPITSLSHLCKIHSVNSSRSTHNTLTLTKLTVSEPASIAICLLLIILALIILVLASSPTLSCDALMFRKPRTLLLQFLKHHGNVQICPYSVSPQELGISRLYCFMAGKSQNLSLH